MANGENMPLTRQSSLKTMVDCEVEFGLLEKQFGKYRLRWSDESGEHTSSNEFTVNEDKTSRTESTDCFRAKSSMGLSRDAAKQKHLRSRTKRDTPRPSITSVTPRDASPNGGVLITIFGENLKSTQLDISGVTDESEDQGENFKIWFEREIDGVTHSVPCDIDRMFGLHVKPLQGQDWLVCKTRQFPIWTRWYLRVQIDDGDVMHSSGIDFYENEGPTVDFFFPQASSPAKPAGAYDYADVFYSQLEF